MVINFTSLFKIFCLLSLLLTACQGSAAPAEEVGGEATPLQPGMPPIAEPTSLPPTAIAVSTVTPSLPPAPTGTPKPSATATPQAISAESLSQLAIIYRFSHPIGVLDLAFSPDSSLLASSAQDGMARLWRIQDEVLLFTLEGHGEPVRSLAFSPDGKLLATGSDDQTVKIWRVEDGSLFRTFDTSMVGKVLKVRFSNDNSLVFIAGDLCYIMLRNVQTGLTRRILKQPRCLVDTGGFVQYWGLEVLPTGAAFVSGEGQPGGNGGSIQLWNYEEYAEPQLIKGYSLVIRDLSLSADGANLAIASAASADIWLFPLQDPASVTKLIGHTYRVNSLHFSADGSLLVSGGRDETVRLWDTASGELLATLHDLARPVNRVTFSPNGSFFAAGSDEGKIIVWGLDSP